MTIKAAGILFLDAKNNALFLKRGPGGDWPGAWCFPGGKLDGEETAEQAAVREAKEECGEIPAGTRELLARRVALDPVTIPGAVPPDAPNAAAAVPAAQAIAQPEEVDFSTFVQRVSEQFTPTVDGEHVGFAWAPASQPPEPLHPGCRVALARLTMDELGIARAMAAGELSSPQRYKNVVLFDLRITGTGVSYRNEKRDDKGKIEREAEFVYRRPENYLTDEFLARCNGLPVIMLHPKKALLDSNEFAARTVGTVMLPYIKGDEVWGIAKIYDDDAIKLMETMPLSTSPGILLGNDNFKLTMEDGSPLLVEGKPSLLDHLAVCQRGVWDKGGEPTGVNSIAIGDSSMTEEEKKAAEKAKADAEKARADAQARSDERLDKLLTGLDSIARRMDALEEDKKAADAKKKADDDAAKKKADDDARKADDKAMCDRFARKDGEKDEDYGKRCDAEEETARAEMEKKGEAKEVAADRAKKARKDAEDEDKKKMDAKRKADEEEEKKKADAAAQLSGATAEQLKALQDRFAALEQHVAKPMTDADYAAMTECQARYDSIYAQFGQQAARPLAGEVLAAYERRLARGLQPHSARFKDLNLSTMDQKTFDTISPMIRADALEVAKNPTDIPAGMLRPISRKLDSGHTVTEWRGQPRDWMDQFAGPVRKYAKGSFRVPGNA